MFWGIKACLYGFCVGFNSRNVSRDGNYLSSSSSKFSLASVPMTPRSEGEILEISNLKNYSFSELKMATRNFRPDSVLGEGGFGSVFKGWIDEHSLTATRPGTGIVIAVKRLNQEGLQGHKEWLVSILFLFLVGAFSCFRKLNVMNVGKNCKFQSEELCYIRMFREVAIYRASPISP